MNGLVITGSPIAVDFWHWRKCLQSKIFFLSHAHSDHTSGLSSTWRQPIYCSEVTGKIAVAKCGVKQSLIKPLSTGEAHIIPLDEKGKETMTVTLIDANHCPGATMFLFEGYFGRFVYTGDFRYHPAMLNNSVLGLKHPVDRLYLDNTYNCPKSDFPSEVDCKVRIMEVLAQHPFTNIVIGMHQLGKEDLLVDIAEFFDEMIQVTPERMSMLQLLDCKPVFTTEPSRIRVVQVHTITVSAVELWNREIPTIVVIPSAIFKAHRKSYIGNHPNVFIIPYSSHSSYSELMKFVEQVRPRKIIPIVQPPPSKENEKAIADMSNFSCFLDPTSAAEFSIPSTVQEFMISRSYEGEFKRSALKKGQSFGDKLRVTFKSAKGVVFEDFDDVHDKDGITQQKEEGSCNNVNAMDCMSRVQTTCSEQEHSVCDSKPSHCDDNDKRTQPQNNESTGEHVSWQICHETFYSSPEQIRRSPRKRQKHVCEHAQSRKTCLCQFLVARERKEKETSMPSSGQSRRSNRDGRSLTNQDKSKNKVKSNGGSVVVVSRTPQSNRRQKDSLLHPGIVNTHNSNSLQSKSAHRRSLALAPMAHTKMRDSRHKFYSAIQNFYDRTKMSDIT